MIGVCEKHGCNFEHRGKGFYCPECEKEKQEMFLRVLGKPPTRGQLMDMYLRRNSVEGEG
jgi:anaerobic ribonucleoside-triphosphate reductase